MAVTENCTLWLITTTNVSLVCRQMKIFLQTTTVKGLVSTRIGIKILWILAVITGLSLSIVNVVSLTSTYLSYETVGLTKKPTAGRSTDQNDRL